MLGTIRWMAPEVLRLKEGLKPKIDWRKADTYSFAMTCSEILTGATPFSEDEFITTAKLYDRITKGGERPKLSSACPEFLACLLTQCWDTNPARRPGFIEICTMLQLFQNHVLKGSIIIHKSWSFREYCLGLTNSSPC
jgi:serine/threonine protein kinase